MKAQIPNRHSNSEHSLKHANMRAHLKRRISAAPTGLGIRFEEPRDVGAPLDGPWRLRSLALSETALA